MDSSLDPLEHVFLEGMAIRDAHDHARAMIASVLDRQSLTEMPVDYSRGLKDALKLAKDCKGLLHAELYDEALTVFVKAFAVSPFCLEVLEEVTGKLVYALHLVLHNHVRKYGDRPMPDVCMAAKLIMLGFQMVAVPPVREAFALLLEDSCGYRGWSQHQAMYRLGFDKLMWVIDVAKFRTCYRMALHCKVHRNCEVNAYWRKFASNIQDHFDDMFHADQTHPFLSQACVQGRLLLQTIGEPFKLEWNAMQEFEGYQVAMHRFADPALAINHVLQAMYASIQSRQTSSLLMGASWEKLGEHEKNSLQQSADTVMHLIDVLQIEPYVWDSVKGKVLASMFILANTWDLATHLDDHQMVHFIEDQHSIQRELLQRPKASSEPMIEELVQELEDISLLAKKLQPDPRSDEQQFNIDQRCIRCDRRITTKCEAVQCKLCGCPYCSPECQRKHSQSHKGPCKRAKLKAKLAAKPSAK